MKAGAKPPYVPKYSSEQLSQLPSFNKQVKSLLQGMSREKFRRLRLARIKSLSDSELQFVRQIRDFVPPITDDTIMQRTLPIEMLAKYLDPRRPGVGPMRMGYYARYQGQEFEVYILEDKSLSLISTDPANLANGFVLNEFSSIMKPVARQAVDELYAINTRARYKGYVLLVIDEEDGKLLLTGLLSEDVARQLGFKNMDKGVWEKLVSPKEIEEMWEEKTPL